MSDEATTKEEKTSHRTTWPAAFATAAVSLALTIMLLGSIALIGQCAGCLDMAKIIHGP